MFGIEFGEAGNAFTIAIVYGGMVVAALWLTMILWTFRDMRARSRDTMAQFLVAIMVAVLTLPGLIIYLFLRPRETLSEAYERSLEEEALLQEIEEKPTCPGCGQRVYDDWQVCAYCHTRLKKACIACGRMLELPWNICPHCTTSQTSLDMRGLDLDQPRSQEPQIRLKKQNTAAQRSSTAASLEFVDGDDY